ncbi:MAG TPA: polysaccharide deacetylase family protein [Dehalococcoidia bacterium]|nr:polysaccharide deacetylase family protein [Dehalococcoidia bacterium]
MLTNSKRISFAALVSLILAVLLLNACEASSFSYIPAVNVSGIVFDGVNDTPLEGVSVAAEAEDGSLHQTWTDHEGEFHLPLKGLARLLVQAEGYEPQTVDARGGNPPLLVRLLPQAESAARWFMEALVGKRFGELWKTLAPEEQAVWQGEEEFSRFLGGKFGQRGLSFSLGQSVKAARWVNPDTRKSAENVTVVPVSLTVDGRTLPAYPLALVSQDGGWRVLGPGPAARQGPVLPPATPALREIRVPILMYHHVSDSPPHNNLQRSLTVTNAQFAEELEYLRSRRYTTITLTDLYNAMYYGLSLPERPIILTFDDGYADHYTDAFRLLKQYGFIGTFAVFTNGIDKTAEGYLTAVQIQEMAAAGMEFVSHTINHADLGAAPEAQVIEELRVSREVLSKLVGWPVQFLIYPYGSPFARGSQADQARVVKLVQQEGYAGAVTTRPSTVQSSAQPYALNRINVARGISLQRFAGPLPW